MRAVPSSRVELYQAIRLYGQGRRGETRTCNGQGRALCIEGCFDHGDKDDEKIFWTTEEFFSLVEQCISELQQVTIKRPLVGIYLDNSVLYVASVVACLAVDCAFVPLHARYSKSRLALMMTELQPSVVVVGDRDVPGGLGVSFDVDSCAVLCVSRASRTMDSTGFEFRRCGKRHGVDKTKEKQEKDKACDIITDDTLYILYTSGTTSGDSQKPVYGSIYVLMNRLEWQACEIPWREQGDVVSFHTPTCFVDHVCQIFGPLLTEKHVSILCMSAEVYLEPYTLVSLWREHSCTHVTLTPTLWRLLLASVNRVEEFVKSVRVAISSGEVLHSDLLKMMQDVFRSQQRRIICNLYGTTGTGGDCTYFDCTHFDTERETTIPIPVGRALPRYTVTVDDDRGVCISGDFHGRMKTEYPGDLGFFDSQGNLVITGRSGGLQKVKGEFIDVDGMIKSIKAQVDGVLDVMFVPVAESSQIVCFVFWRREDVGFADVRRKCRDIIGPGSAVIIMDGNVDIPMNLSGKVDVNKLQLQVNQCKHHSTAGRNESSEQRVMEVLAECLDIPMNSFEPTDSIFDLGATSSSVVAIANQLHLPVDEVFYHHHSARALARRDRKRPKVAHDSLLKDSWKIEDCMLWSRDIGSCVDAPCHLLHHGGLLCCSHQGRLDALSSAGSDVLFTLKIRDKVSATLAELEGVLVIPGSAFGVTFVCARTGKEYIQHRLNIGARVSPCVVGTKVLFGSYDGYIAAVDVRKMDRMYKLMHVGGPVACTLEYCQEADRCIAATLKGEIIALDVAWNDDTSDSCVSQAVWSKSVEDVVFAKPLHVNSSTHGHCVVTVSLHGIFCCFDLETGSTIFQKSFGEISKFFIDPILYKTGREEHIIVVSQNGHVITINLGTFSDDSMALFPLTSGIEVYTACLNSNINILLASCSDNLIRIIRLAESDKSIFPQVEACVHMPNSVHSLLLSDLGLGYFGCRDNHIYCIDVGKITKSTM
ncbi:hypothetical protein M9434_000516 [Picochlorum sp. BPE23]|nr:hypothetical protein M9434_000516 [Picochlorum sp. BPE23]